LLSALGWHHDESELALPIPADPRAVIDSSAARSLIVVAGGDPMALRRTLCSIIDRSAARVAVTVAMDGERSTAMDAVLASLATAAPAIEVIGAGALRAQPGAQRLTAGEELPWGWPDAAEQVAAPAVAYILPGMPRETAGGVLSVVQEARGLRAIGAEARVCVPVAALERAEFVYGNQDDLFVSYPDDAAVTEAVGDATVVVATEHASVPLLARIARSRPEIACAYYVQDYEPLFAQLGSPRSDRALLSYRAVPGAALYAKTHFIRNVVIARHGVAVTKVEPSLNRSLFHDHRPNRKRGATVTAMVRPRTPRRRPGATLDSLAMVKAALGEDVTIVTFGCDQHELDAIAGKSMPQMDHLGVLRPEEVADHLRRCDVFIDASAYQGFGRAGLEAMAAGAVPVLPALGGVHEYAIDGENAILFEDDSPTSIAGIVVSVLKDRARLRRLAAAGTQRATRYSLDRAARAQFDFLAGLARSRSLE
jgi:hypothetical protein